MTESISKIPLDQADAQLEARLIEGLASGEDIPLSADFWTELRQDAAKILARPR